VTPRVHAEAERERFVSVLQNTQDFIGICDLRGVPSFVNRAGLEMVGLDSLEQAKLTPLAEFFFEEDRSRVIGEFLPQVLRDGQGEIEIRFRHFKTGAARWMAYKVLALRDHTGAPTGFATVSQDVTERKARGDDLIEADRRKNEFLAMLAHELRNPLAPLSNAVRAIRRRAPGDEHTVAVAADTQGGAGCPHGCDHALDGAVITPADAWPAATRRRLAALAPRLFSDRK